MAHQSKEIRITFIIQIKTKKHTNLEYYQKMLQVLVHYGIKTLFLRVAGCDGMCIKQNGDLHLKQLKTAAVFPCI
jgi:hypothetical protein